MNTDYTLELTLLSDATFGRGDGITGLIDQEVEHDANGLPFLRGRTLKGLLCEECANTLYALDHLGIDMAPWHVAADELFGRPGSGIPEMANFSFGDAQLPEDIRLAVAYEVALAQETASTKGLQPATILDSLTAIRRQTAMDDEGVPERASLRAMRVVLRTTTFVASVQVQGAVSQYTRPLLAACVASFRRAGTGRNRGRGRLTAKLLTSDGQPLQPIPLAEFRRLCDARVALEQTPQTPLSEEGV